ncbi:hypothetical protein LX59_01581 [Azomonas agilis]|uniref:Uncharacterized protein n=1 Tax=Azomonas agilis TaxID=116849 RepID=A0A562IK79_9GAMM|nr:hypothetical protein [Azomonas agilis]TWH71298.1 hypothetical protein LX59_01581 [Azomonas agilis]
MQKFFVLFVALFLSLFGIQAFAAGADFSSLTSAVELDTIITAVLAVAALLAAVYAAIKGASIVLAFLRR